MNSRTLQKKNGRIWQDIETTHDDTIIFKSLSQEYTHKYQFKSNWVKRITTNIYYSGTQNEIIVTFDNGYRNVYILDK